MAKQPRKPHQPRLVTPEYVAEFVERTTREQGVPLKVQDPVALQQVATLLNTPTPKPPASPAGSMDKARDLLWQGYHVDHVVALTGVDPADVRHLVAADGYVK